MSHQLIEIVLIGCALPVLAATWYLFALTLCSRRTATRRSVSQESRFDIVVPAHNEQDGIAETVRNLLALDYPPHLRRVLVVADNCSDETADRALCGGAMVIERRDFFRRGKGYALAYAFDRCLADGFADAVVIVDADTLASPDLLRAFSTRLREGAEAIQGHYTVRNPEASWRTRLMAVAFSLFHNVRSLARERLGLSVGLRGNGMCFSAALLRRVPHAAYSIVEDVEYGIRLGLEGCRVHYADDAVVLGDMVASENGSRSQRRRWEDGRRALRRKYVAPLLKSAFLRRDLMLLDLALDLLVPPLSVVAAAVAAGSGVTLILSLRAGHVLLATYAWMLSAGFMGAYVLRGVWLAGMGGRGFLALLYAPIYVGWKLVLPLLSGEHGDAWIRTTRERRTPAAGHDLVATPVPTASVEAPPRRR